MAYTPAFDEMLWFDESKLQEVLRRKKPTRYFWCDMTDMFGDWVPDEWIAKCFRTMAATPHHTHQVLTKRADRMAGVLTGPKRHDQWPKEMWHRSSLAHIHLGFSAENQKHFDERAVQIAPLMRDGWMVFVSAEPLLGSITMHGHDGALHRNWLGDDGIRWVIVGGESGHGARPMHPDWVRSLRDQCGAAGVPFFFKQWGSWSIHEHKGDGIYPPMPIDQFAKLKQYRPDLGRFCDVPADAYVSEVFNGRAVIALPMAKKQTGRLLDGREWNELPGRLQKKVAK